MSNGTLSIPQAAAQAYRDLSLVLRSLGVLPLIALVVVVAAEITQSALVGFGQQNLSRNLLMMFVASIVQSFLLTPYFIAVHRLVILGEVTTIYVLTPREPRFQQFFAWLLMFWAVTYVATFVMVVLTPWPGGVLVAVLAVSVPMLVIAMRLSVLLPAIAVDAPGATWQGAMADTKGKTWRILLVGAVALLPLGFVATALLSLVGRTRTFSISTLFSAMISGVFGIAMTTLVVAIASRLYEQIGARVKQPV